MSRFHHGIPLSEWGNQIEKNSHLNFYLVEHCFDFQTEFEVVNSSYNSNSHYWINFPLLRFHIQALHMSFMEILFLNWNSAQSKKYDRANTTILKRKKGKII